MTAALGLARRGLGRVWPNPAVGCVLVRPDLGNRVVGRGWTQPGGRPHAETEALSRAGTAARGATAYVTLEPCSHYGKTPPCADALIAAGVARVVAAMVDPDPRVAGRGLDRLQEAGIAVSTGLCEAEARDLNAGFLLRVTENRPFVTLKAATTLDGRIATASGESRWITGEAARLRGHGLRAGHDAILVGIETVLADDPTLTCRLPGLEETSPIRIVADSQLRLPLDGMLARTATEIPVWVVCARGADPARGEALTKHGITVIETETGENGRPDVDALLAELAKRGITRLLVEGGGRIAASFLAADRVDGLAWFRAPSLIGGDGRPAVGGLALERLADAPLFAGGARIDLGADLFEEFRRRK